MKDLLLKKGWAGRTMSRAESVERLNPLLRAHHELNYTYDAAIARLSGDESTELSRLQRTARADGGKISESILSLGGRPESGVDMDPASFDPGSDRGSILQRLLEMERSFADKVAAESKFEHQMRSRAILGNTESNARKRLDYLKSIVDART
jgi:hypothetical protein